MDSEDKKIIDSFLEKNIILLNTKVEGDMVMHAYRCLLLLECRGSPDVEVRIFSNGGSVAAGLDIYDALRRYKGRETGVVYAYARSMGAILLQACDERISLPHARILIHYVRTREVSLDLLESKARLDRLRSSLHADQEALTEILMKRTGRTKREVTRACEKDEDMSAQEAKAFGLIDHIWEPGKA